jgi:MFS family permease
MGLSEIQVVVFVVVGQLSTLAWQPLVPGMLEKAHGIRLIRRARLFIALIPIAYAAATFWPSEEGFWLLLIVQVACGQPVAVMNIAAPTVVSSASPRMERARRFGIHNAGIGIAALVGSSAAGIAVDSIMGYGTSLEEILVWVYLLSVVLRFSVAWFGFRVEGDDSPRVTDVLPTQ